MKTDEIIFVKSKNDLIIDLPAKECMKLHNSDPQ